MKHYKLPVLTLCLSALAMTATAQNVTIQKQGGVGHVYEMEQVDSVVYFPIGDTEQFPAQETENTKTLWDIIKAQPNLKKFAAILEAATYYSDRSHPTGLHFSQVLDGNVPMNVYAPSDAAISDVLYYKMLNQTSTDGWKLQQEFIANHISAQEFFYADEDDVITMLNGKLFNGNAINVLSTNGEAATGNLHVVSSILPYTPNMEEYLLEFAPGCSQAQQFLAAINMTYLDLGKSVSVPSMDGSIQILDSVFTQRNPIMEPFFINNDVMQVKGFGADLANERASYNMVMPTDEVWNDAQTKLASLYKYASIYVDKAKGDMGIRQTMTIDNPDSLSALARGADILVPLFGRTSAQLATLSNGTAYAETAWPVPVSEYKPDVEVEIENTVMFYDMTNSRHKLGADAKRYSFSNEKYKEITKIYGEVSNSNFFHLDASGATAGPKVDIKLFGNSPSAYVPNAQVMKGKYDIQVVVVPYWYLDIAKASAIDDVFYVTKEIVNPDDETDIQYEVTDEINTEYIETRASMNKYKLKATIEYNNNKGADAKKASSNIKYDGLKVDTLTVLQDFEFPYSYKNMRFSYPTLYLEGVTSKTDAKNGFIYSLCIDKIILKSKEDDSEIEITP